jgi:hypothetical protein
MFRIPTRTHCSSWPEEGYGTRPPVRPLVPPPRQGKLTTGRLTGRAESDRSRRPCSDKAAYGRLLWTGGPGYGVSFHQLRTCRRLGLGSNGPTRDIPPTSRPTGRPSSFVR